MILNRDQTFKTTIGTFENSHTFSNCKAVFINTAEGLEGLFHNHQDYSLN